MADDFISGVNATVTMTLQPSGSPVEYSFEKWSFPVDGGTRKFFAFGSNFQRTLPGGIAGEITLEGAYNAGNMPLVIGSLYTIALSWDGILTLTVTGRLSKYGPSAETGQGGKPGGQLQAVFDSDGSFTVSFT